MTATTLTPPGTDAGTRSPRKTLRAATWLSTFGGLLFGYDTGVMSGALPFIKDDMRLTPVGEAWIASSLLLGAALGSLVIGRVADRRGRRKTLLVLALIFFVAALGCTLAPNIGVMIAFRAVLGIAVGGASVTVPLYLAEVSPADRRGAIVTRNELMIVTGQLLAFTFNAAIGATLGDNAHVWRFMLVVATLPAVVLWFGMLAMPESPRWLTATGRAADAYRVLLSLRDEATARAEATEINDAVTADRDERKATFRDLGIPWIRNIVLLGIGIGVCQQVAGVNSIMMYGTKILQESGWTREAALVGQIANGVISVLATFVGIWLLGRVGRRPMLITGQIGCVLALLTIGIVSIALEGTTVLPFIVLALTVTFLAFQQGAISPVTWLMLSEIFPTRLRGLGMGFAVLFLWLANFAVVQAFPILVDRTSISATFFMFVGINIFAILFTTTKVPETKGRTLEQLEHDFRVKGGDLPAAKAQPTMKEHV